MNNIVVYVHGKGGSAEEAAHYKALFPDSEVIGFDYLAQTPWEAKEEFPPFFAGLRQHCGRLILIANSIGAFFSLSALDETLVDQALLISPVVDMDKLIGNIILYGERDNLTSLETISAFAEGIGAELTFMPGGEHWFHTEEQMWFLDHWITKN